MSVTSTEKAVCQDEIIFSYTCSKSPRKTWIHKFSPDKTGCFYPFLTTNWGIKFPLSWYGDFRPKGGRLWSKGKRGHRWGLSWRSCAKSRTWAAVNESRAGLRRAGPQLVAVCFVSLLGLTPLVVPRFVPAILNLLYFGRDPTIFAVGIFLKPTFPQTEHKSL